MKWASAISQQTDLGSAIEECAASIKAQLGELTCDLAVAFISSDHFNDYSRVSQLIKQRLGANKILGCSGGGIIGNGQEVEQQSAVSITAANLPDVNMADFHLEGKQLPDLDAAPQAWEAVMNVTREDEPQFVILADPFSFPVQNLLLGLDYAFEKASKIGGLASGGQRQGMNGLFQGDKTHISGAVGVALYGNIEVDTVVAQGCRPIGKPMRITQSNKNLLEEVDGEPPVAVLRSLYTELSPRDQGLMRNSLFLGVVMDEFIDEPRQGDFLIRNVMGMDDATGKLAIGEMLKEGQLVQFHLRDAETSTEDLTAVLDRYASDNRENQAQGALLFSCLGRGQYLYGRPNHDADLFRDKLGSVPLGGFFCNGEIGPVSGTTFLHGYTSSFGIFRPKY